MTGPRLYVRDKPVRPNLANYEQRLRKYRTLVALILTEMDEALEEIARDRRVANDA